MKMGHRSHPWKWFRNSTVWDFDLFHNWLSNGGNGSKWVRSELNVHHGKCRGKNMKGKVCDVTDVKMEKSDPKLFWRSPSQCSIVWS